MKKKRKNVNIGCEACDRWIHDVCVGIAGVHLRELSKLNEIFSCCISTSTVWVGTGMGIG